MRFARKSFAVFRLDTSPINHTSASPQAYTSLFLSTSISISTSQHLQHTLHRHPTLATFCWHHGCEISSEHLALDVFRVNFEVWWFTLPPQSGLAILKWSFQCKQSGFFWHRSMGFTIKKVYPTLRKLFHQKFNWQKSTLTVLVS